MKMYVPAGTHELIGKPVRGVARKDLSKSLERPTLLSNDYDNISIQGKPLTLYKVYDIKSLSKKVDKRTGIVSYSARLKRTCRTYQQAIDYIEALDSTVIIKETQLLASTVNRTSRNVIKEATYVNKELAEDTRYRIVKKVKSLRDKPAYLLESSTLSGKCCNTKGLEYQKQIRELTATGMSQKQAKAILEARKQLELKKKQELAKLLPFELKERVEEVQIVRGIYNGLPAAKPIADTTGKKKFNAYSGLHEDIKRDYILSQEELKEKRAFTTKGQRLYLDNRITMRELRDYFSYC